MVREPYFAHPDLTSTCAGGFLGGSGRWRLEFEPFWGRVHAVSVGAVKRIKGEGQGWTVARVGMGVTALGTPGHGA